MRVTVAELGFITQAAWNLLHVRFVYVCTIAPQHLYDTIRFFKTLSLVREKLQEETTEIRDKCLLLNTRQFSQTPRSDWYLVS